jgi:hypothetical protein
MFRLTLDTCCVITGAGGSGNQRHELDRLVDLTRAGRVQLWITTAFGQDQAKATTEMRQANIDWLASAPVLGPIPGPFRLSYSTFDGPDVFVTEDHSRADELIRKIVLPGDYHLRAPDQDPASEAAARWRKRLHDVQHLSAHLMAGHDAFVTDDTDDMMSKKEALASQVGITVIDPAGAVALIERSSK